jgi:cyclopropane fatty-acyl-phospholipid synthase-like methyltransferase
MANSQDYWYPLVSDDAELERLNRLGRVFGPASRIILTSAAITAGITVLDLGCGAGDLSVVAAELVGPEGRVIGIDSAAEADWTEYGGGRNNRNGLRAWTTG